MGTLTVRIALFLSSYSPLLLILAIRDGFDNLVLSILFVIVPIATTLLLLLYLRMAARQSPSWVQVASVQPKGTEIMGYIVTYLIPFLDFDLGNWWDFGALIVLLLAIGAVYVNSNLIYINPVLNFLGYHLFEITSDSGKPSALITKSDYVRPGDRLSVVTLGNYVLMERRPNGDTTGT